jgi:hemerythrin-like domain-containing protein
MPIVAGIATPILFISLDSRQSPAAPPGNNATAAGALWRRPVAMGDSAMDPISVWHGEHMRFSHMLDFLERQMTAFHAGKDPNYELMRDVILYLHDYGDRLHHPREDAAFARLVLRDPEFQAQVNQLLQEHRAISVAGEALLELIEQILEDATIERAKVEAAAALYLVYFRNHLAAEEREVLPRAAKVLTPEDWADVAAAVSLIPDPVFGDDVVAQYRELRGWIAREA